MLSPSRLETVACRFETVVKDLRSFLKDNDVAYGFPEHLLSFTDRLTASESLRHAISLKLHTLVADLPESTSHGDLVEVLLLSVGGFAIDEDTPPMQKAERVLSRIIGEVMTSPHILAPLPPPLAPVLPPPAAAAMAPPLALREKIVQTELRPELARVPDAPPEWAPPPIVLLQAASTAAVAVPIRTRPALTRASLQALLKRSPKRATSPPTFAWKPAPRLVWAALVCGVLFPPGVYLVSQPHAALPGPPSHHARVIHAAATTGSGQLPQPTTAMELDRQTDEDLASIAALGFGSNAGRTHPALSRFHKSRSGVVPNTRQEAPTARTSSESMLVEADVAPRETDMPGRDLGILAPASSSSQDPQQNPPPRP